MIIKCKCGWHLAATVDADGDLVIEPCPACHKEAPAPKCAWCGRPLVASGGFAEEGYLFCECIQYNVHCDEDRDTILTARLSGNRIFVEHCTENEPVKRNDVLEEVIESLKDMRD